MKRLFLILLSIALFACSKPHEVEQGIYPVYSSVIYLDFDGDQMQSSDWNNGNLISLSSSGIDKHTQGEILNIIASLFSQFQVTVTVDKSVYLNADPLRRQKIIFTRTSNFTTGTEPGAAIFSSFGSDTPCFVFTNKLGADSYILSMVAAHELGHTLGLYHQSLYKDCVKLNEYRQGAIMGYPYSSEGGQWQTGSSSLACDIIQDDIKIISQTLPLK